jgi:hypothetical protein
MTGFIVSVFPFRNRVSSKEAFEVLELGEGKLSRPVLRGPGGRKAAWLLGQVTPGLTIKIQVRSSQELDLWQSRHEMAEKSSKIVASGAPPKISARLGK